MRIGIDVYSGERPFQELVEGVIFFAKNNPLSDFFIIGSASKIKYYFSNIDKIQNIYLADSNEVIQMDESPILGLRRKKNSTVTVGMDLLNKNIIDIFFSPGNTGATVASAYFDIGLVSGLKKPGMGAFIPRIDSGETYIMDIGANPDAKVEHLFQYGILGSIFYKLIYGIENVKIGLLSVGTESNKGNSIIKKAFNQFWNLEGFVGNVEPYNIVDGSVDVVVCDGFTGNSLVKFAETLYKLFSEKTKKYLNNTIKSSFFDTIIHGNYIKKIFGEKSKEKLKKHFLPKYYGGSLLLGVNKPVLIGHGMTKKEDLINSMEYAKYLIDNDIPKKINFEFKRMIKMIF